MKKIKIFSVLILLISLFITIYALSLVSCTPEGSLKAIKTHENKESPQTQETATDQVIFPDYNGFVNDYTNTMSKDWKSKTEQLVAKVERETKCEIAVAVIDNLEGLTIEDYAVGLFEKWGIGKKDKDNGVLLLVSMNERELRIEVGYGLEGVVTDIEAKNIIDTVIVPKFKENNYNFGIYNGVVAIANKIYLEQGKAEMAYSNPIPTAAVAGFAGSIAVTVIIILVTILPWVFIFGAVGVLYLLSYIKNHKCPQCKKLGMAIKETILSNASYEYSGKMIIEKTCRYCNFYKKYTVIIPKLSKHTYSVGSSSGHFSSSGSSSSSSSGSSFSHSSSFGGGSSGGGGASGHW
jgi:uncharacterized protein